MCGEVVDYSDIARAFGGRRRRSVVITDGDIATLPEERSREIEVVEFVPAGDIDPIMYDKSCFRGRGKSTKSYVLLAKTLAETDRVAIVHFALRSKTQLGGAAGEGFQQARRHGDHHPAVARRDPRSRFPGARHKGRIKPAELKMARPGGRNR